MDLKYRERTGEIHVMRLRPRQHRWTYFPRHGRDAGAAAEDLRQSETDGRARFMFHTAFEDPDHAGRVRCQAREH
jgi:hypothetical protein